MAAQLRLIVSHLNSAEEKRLCRSPCSLFWARSLLCWEILFQEANRIWHPEPIFSNSHLAAWSAGSTTASDNTSLLDKFFFSQFHIKDFSVFPLLFSWRGFNLNEDVSGGGWRTSVFLLVLFSADAVSRSPTWGYLWLPKLLHVLCADLFSSGAPHYYWQASQQLWKHTAYVEQMLWLHSQTEFSRRQKHQRDHIRTISCSIFFLSVLDSSGGSLAGLIITAK